MWNMNVIQGIYQLLLQGGKFGYGETNEHSFNNPYPWLFHNSILYSECQSYESNTYSFNNSL